MCSSDLARLGKKFAGLIGTGDFKNVKQVKINGKLKRTVGNRAAIYTIISDKSCDDKPVNIGGD